MQQKSSAHLQGGKHCVQSIEVILLFFSVKYQKLISHVQHLVLKIYSYCIFLQSSFDLYVWKKCNTQAKNAVAAMQGGK